MDKKIIPFPGASSAEEDRIRYRRFCEELEENDPVLSFGEFLKREEESIQYMSSLGLTLDVLQDCKNQKEIEQLIQERIDKQNEEIEEDSPEFTKKLELLLEKGPLNAESVVEINRKVPLKMLKKAPLIVMLQILLKIALQQGGFLELSNSEDSFVTTPLWVKKWVENFGKRLDVPFLIEDSFGNDLFIIHLGFARIMLTHLGLMVEKKGQLKLTTLGFELAEGRQVRKVYNKILEAFTMEIDWFFGMEYPEGARCIIDSVGILLFLISVFVEKGTLQELELFDYIKEILRWEDFSTMEYEELLDAYEDSFLKSYCYLMGFLEPIDYFENDDFNYQITDLYRELFFWKITFPKED